MSGSRNLVVLGKLCWPLDFHRWPYQLPITNKIIKQKYLKNVRGQTVYLRPVLTLWFFLASNIEGGWPARNHFLENEVDHLAPTNIDFV